VLASAGPDGAVQTRAWATAGTILSAAPDAPPGAQLDPSWIDRSRALLHAELAPAERILLLGAVALAERARGRHAAATEAAVDALAVLSATPPATSYTLWSTAAVADVLLDAAPDARAARAEKILARLARAMPVAVPRAAIARARLEARRGRRRAAAAAYRKAIAAADRLRMPVDRALAVDGLAQLEEEHPT
jgi:hypothetical protein